MKKILLTLLVTLMLFSLMGCYPIERTVTGIVDGFYQQNGLATVTLTNGFILQLAWDSNEPIPFEIGKTYRITEKVMDGLGRLVSYEEIERN